MIIEQTGEYQDLNIHTDLLLKYIKNSGLIELTTVKKTIEGTIENYLMKNSLRFLKLTSLIKYRLYAKEIPWTVS